MDDTLGEDTPELLIAGRYLVKLDQKQPNLGGCETWIAHDTSMSGSGWLALAPTGCPSRLSEMRYFRHESFIRLHAHEYHEGALWVFCSHPPGPSLAEGFGVWSENQIIDGVIKPIADALQKLEAQGLTCRGIRPDNVFTGHGGLHKIIIGPLGMTQNATLQPVVFEPLSSAVCGPTARGAGTIACDIFSLGVLILSLLIRDVPLKGLSDTEILKRRFEMGTATAYMQGHTIPKSMVSLLHAMLSDTPENRPSPADLITIAPSKLYSIRKEIPARTPLVIGGNPVRTPRALAWYAGQYPNEFLSLLQRKIITQWLLRELELSIISSLIEQLGTTSLPSSDDPTIDPATMTLTQAITILDPSAPMFWAGEWFWPEALPLMLAHSERDNAPQKEQRVIRGIATCLCNNTSLFNTPSLPPRQASQIAHLIQITQKASLKDAEQLQRLPYDDNIHQPCLSRRTTPHRIFLPGSLLQWLNRSMENDTVPPETLKRSGFLDPQERLFLESHCLKESLLPLSQSQKAGLPLWLSDLTLMAAVQRYFDKNPLSSIAVHALPFLETELKQWKSKTARENRRAKLSHLAEGGNLSKFLENVHDPAGLKQDHALARQAREEISQLQQVLAQEPDRKTAYTRHARNAGEFTSLLFGIAVAMLSIWLEFCA